MKTLLHIAYLIFLLLVSTACNTENAEPIVSSTTSALIPTKTPSLEASSTPTHMPSTPTSAPSPTTLPAATPTPIADWSTYDDTEYGFSFEYPEKCKVIKNETNYEQGHIFSVAGGDLIIVDAPKNINLAEHVDEVINEYQDDYWILTFKESGLVGGEKAITIEYRFGGTGRFGTATFLERRGKLYTFNLAEAFAACANPVEAYRRMLATFQFID